MTGVCSCRIVGAKTCVMENETHGGHRKKMYGNNYGRMLQLAVEQGLANTGAFLEC